MHDTDAGFSASNPVFTDEEIALDLVTARSELVRLLAGGPKPPYVTLSRIIKMAPATDGSAVPGDFWKLICGISATGLYVPATTLRIGEAMKNVAVDQVYVKGATFFGTATSALYWAMPSQLISIVPTALTEFNDAFYHCVKYQAALALLGKEEANAWTRFAAISQDLQRKLLSLN